MANSAMDRLTNIISDIKDMRQEQLIYEIVQLCREVAKETAIEEIKNINNYIDIRATLNNQILNSSVIRNEIEITIQKLILDYFRD